MTALTLIGFQYRDIVVADEASLPTPTAKMVNLTAFATAEGTWHRCDGSSWATFAGGSGVSSLLDLDDVSGTDGAGKAPVSTGSDDFVLTEIATADDLSGAVTDLETYADASVAAEAAARGTAISGAVATAEAYTDTSVAAEATARASAVTAAIATAEGFATSAVATEATARDAAIAAAFGANDAMLFKGVIDCSANPNYPDADAGHTYRVSVAGKIGGGSGLNVEIGDMLVCITDSTASGNQATVGSHWTLVQANIDGAVVGPASATSGNLASYSGTSGKLIQDSGVAVDVDGTLAGNSDAKLPSQKAVKTAIAAEATARGTADTAAIATAEAYADTKVAANGGITGATKTKVTYDAKGLVTAGADATTADIADSTDKRYVTDAQRTVLASTSGVNTGDQTSVSGNAGTATALATARNIDGQAFDGTAAITVIAPGTHAATSKATPIDADEFPLVDSAASNVLKKLTWANLKATLKTYFDTLYVATTDSRFNQSPSEVDLLTVAATAGTFKLTVADSHGNSGTTGTIPFNGAAATVATAIRNIGGFISNPDISVAGSAGGPWTLTWQNNLAGQGITVTTDATLLTGGAHTATITRLVVGILNTRRVANVSLAAQTIAAASRTYLIGSTLSLAAGQIQVGTILRWTFNMTKTGAGTASSTIDVCFGTAGTTADTARVSFTKPAGTGVIDEGKVTIECVVRKADSTGVVAGDFTLTHNLAATGHSVLPGVAVETISGSFDLTTPTFVGVCLTTGASDAITVQQVVAEALNV